MVELPLATALCGCLSTSCTLPDQGPDQAWRWKNPAFNRVEGRSTATTPSQFRGADHVPPGILPANCGDYESSAFVHVHFSLVETKSRIYQFPLQGLIYEALNGLADANNEI